MKLNDVKELFEPSKVVSLVLCIFLIVGTDHRADGMEYIFDLPREELQQILVQEECVSTSVSSSVDGRIYSRQQHLTGVCAVGELLVEEGKESYSIKISGMKERIKLAFLPDVGEMILWEDTAPNNISLGFGAYDVYCIGKNFRGSVTITAESIIS